MSVNSKMTALADLIRGLRCVSGTIGLDAMAAHLTDERAGLDSALTALADKGVIIPDDTNITGLAGLIAAIEAGGELQEKTVTPSTEQQEVTPDDGYYGLSKVVVEAVESGGSGGNAGGLFDSSASGRIPDYDRGYADSILDVVKYGFVSSATGTLS